MSQELIGRAFGLLGERLHARGISGEIMLVGGAAMCLAYSARAMTKDVDAVFSPKSAVAEEAAKVAEEIGLDRHWLNDGVKGFLSHSPPGERRPVYSVPGLDVWAPPPEYIFAMKCLASRQEDRGDIIFLANLLGVSTYSAASSVVLRYYPASRILPKTRFMLEGIFGQPE